LKSIQGKNLESLSDTDGLSDVKPLRILIGKRNY
jgi:hypothetical protein